jgi:phage terminase large subunit-like protein
MRGHSYEFAKAAEMVCQEINDGDFTHDGHPATGRHVVNARRKAYRDAITVGKETPGSPKKIDAAVCVIGARMVRRLVLAAAPTKQRTGVVW